MALNTMTAQSHQPQFNLSTQQVPITYDIRHKESTVSVNSIHPETFFNGVTELDQSKQAVKMIKNFSLSGDTQTVHQVYTNSQISMTNKIVLLPLNIQTASDNSITNQQNINHFQKIKISPLNNSEQNSTKRHASSGSVRASIAPLDHSPNRRPPVCFADQPLETSQDQNEELYEDQAVMHQLQSSNRGGGNKFARTSATRNNNQLNHSSCNSMDLNGRLYQVAEQNHQAKFLSPKVSNQQIPPFGNRLLSQKSQSDQILSNFNQQNHQQDEQESKPVVGTPKKRRQLQKQPRQLQGSFSINNNNSVSSFQIKNNNNCSIIEVVDVDAIQYDRTVKNRVKQNQLNSNINEGSGLLNIAPAVKKNIKNRALARSSNRLSTNTLSFNFSKQKLSNFSPNGTPAKKKQSKSQSFTSEEEDDDGEPPRQDKFGNKIMQGSKNHKICFVDEYYPHKSVKNVIIVENFKKYNRDDYRDGNNAFCNCAIF